MKRIVRNVIAASGVLTALILGWGYARSCAKKAENLPGLCSLQADELHKIAGYRRSQLIDVWGDPDDVIGESRDIWNREGGECLIVTYTGKKKVKEAVLAIL